MKGYRRSSELVTLSFRDLLRSIWSCVPRSSVSTLIERENISRLPRPFHVAHLRVLWYSGTYRFREMDSFGIISFLLLLWEFHYLWDFLYSRTMYEWRDVNFLRFTPPRTMINRSCKSNMRAGLHERRPHRYQILMRRPPFINERKRKDSRDSSSGSGRSMQPILPCRRLTDCFGSSVHASC